jgi:hypothetical protein
VGHRVQQAEKRSSRLLEHHSGGSPIAKDNGKQFKVGHMGNFFAEQHFHLL